jgi:hypothetical protein
VHGALDKDTLGGGVDFVLVKGDLGRELAEEETVANELEQCERPTKCALRPAPTGGLPLRLRHRGPYRSTAERDALRPQAAPRCRQR